jgi:hypothetical protein
MNNKIHDLAIAIERGDTGAAIRICCTMKDLGPEDEAIRLARSCLYSPAIYQEMGYEVDSCVKSGFMACKKVLTRLQ